MSTEQHEDVTPGRALELLSDMHSSRRLNLRVVDEHVRLMRLGTWSQDRPVGVDAAGRLLQGQHELTAVLESGVTVPMVITREDL